MARMIPPQWTDPRPNRQAEEQVYFILRQLSDEWTVYHDMAWIADAPTHRTSMIQVDFLVCHPFWGRTYGSCHRRQHVFR